MARGLALWPAMAALALVASCSSAAPPVTGSSVTATAAPHVSPSPTTRPTGIITTTTEPSVRWELALTPYQLALVGLRNEVGVLAAFADEAHAEWDTREAQLSGSARLDLYRQTEQRLVGLSRWSEEIITRLAALEEVEGRVAGHPALEADAARISVTAAEMLDGLRLPASAETTPGTARREAMEDLTEAANGLAGAFSAALGLERELSAYEEDMIVFRLVVGGLVHQADAVNQRWDDRVAGFRLTEWELSNLGAAVLDLAADVGAVAPPPEVESFGEVVDACHGLEAAAEDMLVGLRLPISGEDVPGMERRRSLQAFRAAADAFDRAASLAGGTPEDRWRPVASAAPPRIGTPDMEPPALTITGPASGAVVADTEHFFGTVERGAFVVVGDAVAEVDGSGAWMARPSLRIGKNAVVVTARDASGNVATVTRNVFRGHVLTGDRIGPAHGGDPPDRVIAQFEALFGAPSFDELIEDEPMPWGYAATRYGRFVSWRDAGVFLAFTDGTIYFRTDGEPGLIGWSTTNAIFVTPEGIQVGSSLADLEAAYGARLRVEAGEECGGAGFYVAPRVGAPRAASMHGGLTGPPYTDASVVTSLGGGGISSC